MSHFRGSGVVLLGAVGLLDSLLLVALVPVRTEQLIFLNRSTVNGVSRRSVALKQRKLTRTVRFNNGSGEFYKGSP